MPGIETGAPERTETSRGASGLPSLRSSCCSSRAQLRVDPLHDAGGERAVAQVLAADVGAEDEAGGDRHAEADHLHEARALAAEAVGVRLAGGVERDDGGVD